MSQVKAFPSMIACHARRRSFASGADTVTVWVAAAPVASIVRALILADVSSAVDS